MIPNTTYSWNDVWTIAVTSPKVETFAFLLRDPKKRVARAFVWVFLTGLVSALVLYNQISSILLNNPQAQAQFTQMFLEQNEPLVDMGRVLFLMGLCMAPLSALSSILGYTLLTGLIHFLAERMSYPSKEKRFQDFLYLTGSIIAPINLVWAFLSIIPILSILSIVVFGYQTYLMMVACQTVYVIDFRQALRAVFPPVMLFFVLRLMLDSMVSM